LGSTAVDRARYLDTLRILGTAQALTFSEYSFNVIVSEFHADYQRANQIPYQISCTVLADLGNPTTTLAPAAIDEAINDDLGTVTVLIAQITDSPLSALIATLDTAIAAVTSFASAAQSVVNSVLQPLVAVQARVTVLIGVSGATLAAVTSFGGILPYSTSGASSLASQTINSEELQALYELSAILGRMNANLSTLKTSPNTITVAGGNLFQIAQAQYGNPMAWTGIAKANGLTDPFLMGTVTLYIPPTADTADGVLNA
jgi:nucleoid-associated protein YgaU